MVHLRILACIVYAGCVDLTDYGNEERIDSNGRWEGFVNLTVMVGIFFSGLSFGLGHLHASVSVCRMGCFNSSFIFNEGGVEMINLAMLIVGILLGLCLLNA